MSSITRILLVDDNPSDRALARRGLSGVGIALEIHEITNQEQLNETLAREGFDLVITDYQLNWNNGLRVLEQVKSACPDCPVIMFTGSGDEEIAVEGLKQGLEDYVPKKPKRYASLAASVLRTLQRQSERRALIVMQQERARTAEALRLNEKFAELGRMAGVIAHEINNPLESVVNLLYIAQNHERLDPELKEHLLLAETELFRVAQITKQTLSYYRESTSPSETNLAELIESLISMFGPKINGRVKVRRHFGKVNPVSAYTSQIRQVFSNLISNAIEAMGSEGGVLAIHVHESRKWNQPSVRGVRVTISDTGQGIAKDDRKRLFEAFFTTKGEKGTGLGLWVSYGIVVRHSGTIHVRSLQNAQEHGTVFSVFLPYKPNFR